jgi:hypothetical protein
MQSEEVGSNWGLLVQWVMINTFGIMVGLPIVGLIFVLLTGTLDFPNAVAALFVAITGILLGAFQWLVLRSQIERSHWWILSTSIGLAVGVAVIIGAIHWVSDRQLPETGKSLLVGTIFGIMLGIAQWLVLRQHLRHSILWILGSMVGCALGLMWGLDALARSTATVDSEFGVAAIFAGLLFRLMLTYSAITGILLIWLLQDRSKKSQMEAA